MQSEAVVCSHNPRDLFEWREPQNIIQKTLISAKTVIGDGERHLVNLTEQGERFLCLASDSAAAKLLFLPYPFVIFPADLLNP